MKNKVHEYCESLSNHKSHRLYLMQNSGLPGPRANLELAKAFAQTAGQKVIDEYSSMNSRQAHANTPEEFLAFCGILGLGRLAMEGKEKSLGKLRKAASDKRWRIREAVAMALQMIGHFDMDWLIGIARNWIKGNYFEQRAAIAGLCEPDLLWDPRFAKPVFEILEQATVNIEKSKNRRTRGFKVLRKGLAYCWSVAVAAYPNEGKPIFENWVSSEDRDVKWIVKQNLKKKRLQKIDPNWVERLSQRLIMYAMRRTSNKS
ncbi:hypothetical protein NC796_19070 [Aliifodinibius sp. S!AR15-10]|uniref:hypothetical protein n=1 Tax=Aliifodinibius sp. S!AR15-10 TaxID=2950437 RepID=UPI00286558F1|nr:hypothetical protein [Aliifodinibius sp. S!AR15-10]MDR8393264.1 hypothetical protein [Aliifodinibius sp. S!AR15-10]